MSSQDIQQKIKKFNNVVQLILYSIIHSDVYDSIQHLNNPSDSDIYIILNYIFNNTNSDIINSHITNINNSCTTIDTIHTFIVKLIKTLFTNNNYFFLNYDGTTFSQQTDNSIVKVNNYYYMSNIHSTIHYKLIIIKVTTNTLSNIPINIVFITDTISIIYTLSRVLIIDSSDFNKSLLCIVHNNNIYIIKNPITDHTFITEHTPITPVISINEWLRSVNNHNNYYIFYT